MIFNLGWPVSPSCQSPYSNSSAPGQSAGGRDAAWMSIRLLRASASGKFVFPGAGDSAHKDFRFAPCWCRVFRQPMKIFLYLKEDLPFWPASTTATRWSSGRQATSGRLTIAGPPFNMHHVLTPTEVGVSTWFWLCRLVFTLIRYPIRHPNRAPTCLLGSTRPVG